jgi:uncharacterized repeat protein (TIGR04138 family)
MSTRTRKKTETKPIHRDSSYPPGAIRFLLEGLEYSVERVHGPTTKAWRVVADWLAKHDLGLKDLERLSQRKKLPQRIERAVRAVGGTEAFNRHVTGEQLCWGLRDLAARKWGLMATTVLRHWGIRRTRDFGEMVFALVKAGRLQKQPHDRIADFEDVYDFRQAFEMTFRAWTAPRQRSRSRPDDRHEAAARPDGTTRLG